MSRVLVVGAGVVGLTCAVRLLEARHRVDVVARDLPLETTSAVAGALWYPTRVRPRERVVGWYARSYPVFSTLAEDDATGVRLRWGTELLDVAPTDPGWAHLVPDLARATVGGRPGWTFTTPIIEMPVYLGWLRARVEELGGSLTRLNLSALPDVDHPVVNCSGIGSRLLAGDHGVAPVRGQVVWVEQVGLEQWWYDAAGPAYLLPRSRDIVVGGTEEVGDWSRTPSPDTARAILERAERLVPGISRARVLRHRVGLRPARDEVRLERVGDVVHCYGHGGAGVTLSWGCADEVVALLDGQGRRNR